MIEITLGKIIANTERKARRVVQKTALEVHSRMQARTPVETGLARSGWHFEMDHDGLGATSRNGVEYIGVLEYGGFPDPPKVGVGKTVGGYSRQAPQGMVRVTVLEVPDIVASAIKSER